MKVPLKSIKKMVTSKTTFYISSCMQARARLVFFSGANQSLVQKHTYTLVMKKVHEQLTKIHTCRNGNNETR